MLLSLEKGRQLRMRRGLWGLPLRGPGGSKGATPPWLLGSLAQSLDGKVEAHLQNPRREAEDVPLLYRAKDETQMWAVTVPEPEQPACGCDRTEPTLLQVQVPPLDTFLAQRA